MLDDLEEGSCRELTRGEVETLYKRCLPLDPLCPTVPQVRDTLRCCVERTARRIRTRMPALQTPALHASGTRVQGIGEGIAKAGSMNRQRHTKTGDFARGEAWGGNLERVVQTIIEYSMRDLHETPEGPDGECHGLENCPGQEESLKRAKAVPPHVAHMFCGYKASQTERLP